jgi:hypothetical protein
MSPVRNGVKGATNGSRDAYIGVDCVAKTEHYLSIIREVIQRGASLVGCEGDAEPVVSPNLIRKAGLLGTPTLVLISNAVHGRSFLCSR